MTVTLLPGLTYVAALFSVPLATLVAGGVRWRHGARGRILHGLTALASLATLLALGMMAGGAQAEAPVLVFVAAGALALGGWLIGAGLTRLRPCWVDIAVTCALLAVVVLFRIVVLAHGHPIPAFSGISAPGPVDPPMVVAP